MSKVQKRLSDEQLQLVERIDKLSDFIDSDNFDNIKKEQKGLMCIQLSIMEAYDTVLVERINNLRNYE